LGLVKLHGTYAKYLQFIFGKLFKKLLVAS